MVAAGGMLSNVTFDGVLGVGLTAACGNQYLFVTGGLTLKNVSGTGDGAATLGSANSYGALIFENSQTVNNATINLVSSSNGCDGSIDAEDTTGGGGQVLTLGGGLTVNSSAPRPTISDTAQESVSRPKASSTPARSTSSPVSW